ncbi:hypothetical protein PAMP_002261 [Pampus punctatissimus]
MSLIMWLEGSEERKKEEKGNLDRDQWIKRKKKWKKMWEYEVKDVKEEEKSEEEKAERIYMVEEESWQ